MGKASKITLFRLHYNESAVDSQVDLFSILASGGQGGRFLKKLPPLDPPVKTF
jgi:hypothetical protein